MRSSAMALLAALIAALPISGWAANAVRLDFGPGESEIEPGYVAVTPATMAGANTSGWSKVVPPVSAHRIAGLTGLQIKPGAPPAGPLYSDYVYGASPAELTVPVGAARSCEVFFVTGHADLRSLEVDFDYSLNDTVRGNVYVYPHVSSGRAAWYVRRHTVGTPDGVLRLTLKPKACWSLFAMVVAPGAGRDPALNEELATLTRSAEVLPRSASLEAAPEPERPFAGNPLEVAADETKAGAVFFCRPWWMGIRPNEIPDRVEIGKPARAFAAQGEIEPVAFALHALRHLPKLEFQLDSFRTESGHALPGNALALWQVVDVPTRTGVSIGADGVATLRWQASPMCVQQLAGPLELEAGHNARLWLVAAAPTNQPAGVYRGTVQVLAENKIIGRVPIQLRMLPFVLERNPNVAFNVYYRRNNKSEAECADLAAHGFNSALLRSNPVSRKDPVTGGVTWDFTALEQDMELLKSRGLNAPRMWLVGAKLGVFTVSGSREELAYTPEKEKIVDDFCRQLAGFLAKHEDWPELYLIFNDEPSRDWHVALANKSAEIAQRHNLKTFCQANGVTDREFLRLQDVLLYYPGYLTPLKSAADIHAAGKKIWINTFCLGLGTNPSIEARAWFGFMPWREKADGASTYAYQEHRGSLRNAIVPGHSAYLLDAQGRPMPTIAWESAREGVDDASYVYTLEQTIKKAAGSDKKPARALAAEAQAALEATRQALLKDTIAPGNYDGFRWQAAWWILRLQKALGELAGEEQAAFSPPKSAIQNPAATMRAGNQAVRNLPGDQPAVGLYAAGSAMPDNAASLRAADQGAGQNVPVTPQQLAADPGFLKIDVKAGQFKCLSMSTPAKEKPSVSLRAVANPAYRGGVGLRVEARTAAAARNTCRFSGYFYPSPLMRGKKLCLGLTVHMLSGSALFCQRPRQWDQGADGTGRFLGDLSMRQACEAGRTYRIKQIVPVKTKANYMDYYFWFSASHPFAAEIEAISIEPVVDPPVKIIPAADVIPAGMSIFRGMAELAPGLWANRANKPANIILIFQDADGKIVATREIKAPESPAADEAVAVAAGQDIVLDLPPDLLPGGHALTVIVKDQAGAELARDRVGVAVLSGSMP